MIRVNAERHFITGEELLWKAANAVGSQETTAYAVRAEGHFAAAVAASTLDAHRLLVEMARASAQPGQGGNRVDQQPAQQASSQQVDARGHAEHGQSEADGGDDQQDQGESAHVSQDRTG